MNGRKALGIALLTVPLSLVLIALGVFMAWYVPLFALGGLAISGSVAAGTILLFDE